MNEAQKATLRKIVKSLNGIGSGLSAIDKTGSWKTFERYQKESEIAISQLPLSLQSRLPSRIPTMHNWSQLSRAILDMIEE